MTPTNDRAPRVVRGAFTALLGVGALTLAAGNAAANQWHYGNTFIIPTDYSPGAEVTEPCHYVVPQNLGPKHAALGTHQVGGGSSHVSVIDSSWQLESHTGQLAAYSPGITLHFTCVGGAGNFTETRFLPVWAEYGHSYEYRENCPASHPWVAAALCESQAWW